MDLISSGRSTTDILWIWCWNLSLCALVQNWILETRVLGEVEENIALPGKGGHSGLMPWKMMSPQTGGFNEEFYSNCSRMGLLIRLGFVWKGLHSFNLVSGNLPDEFLWFFLTWRQVVFWLLLSWLATVPVMGRSWRLRSCIQEMGGQKRLPCPGAPQGPA